MIDKDKIDYYYKIRENRPERTRTLRGYFYFSNDEKDENNIADDSIFMESYKLFMKDIDPNYKIKKYQTQILLVGFSIEPIILSILGLSAKRIIFIYSDDTRGECTTIIRYIELIEKKLELDLKYEFISKDELYSRKSRFCIDSSLPHSTFHAINAAVAWEIEENGIPREEICINVTGGKKSMGNGAYIAANILNIDTYYVDFRSYEHDRPTFGTEKLIGLPRIEDIVKSKKLTDSEKKDLSKNLLSFIEDTTLRSDEK